MDLLPYIALLPARRPFQATDVEVAIFRTGAPMADPAEVADELARLVDVETLVTSELTMHWGIAKSPLDNDDVHLVLGD